MKPTRTPTPTPARTRPPSLLPSYARALIRRRAGGAEPGPGALPNVETLLPNIRADRERVRAYAHVCGFATTDHLPPTYPHVLAFPAAMDLMTRKGFPLPLLGLVHTGNRISVRRPIDTAEPLTVLVHAADLRQHPAGLAFDVLTQIADQRGDVVWESASTYLHRDGDRARERPKGPAEAADDPSQPDESVTAQWHVPANTGRRYAALSGDRNPIHLHPWTARLFGFRSAIAHGMWTKARILAALEPGLPPAYTIDVAFRAPVPLPSTVRLRTTPRAADTDIGFTLDAADSARPRVHLDGAVTFEL
jgi:acyl dehydratase